MTYDESRALLGEPERPRRPVPIFAIVLGAAAFAGIGVAAGLMVSAKRETENAMVARAAAEAKAAEDARFAAARFTELERVQPMKRLGAHVRRLKQRARQVRLRSCARS